MADFAWDLVLVFLICVTVLAALVLVPFWIGKAMSAGAREMPEPPAQSEPTGPRCSRLDCGRLAVEPIHGWWLCAGHLAAIRNRKPYDQERSAS